MKRPSRRTGETVAAVMVAGGEVVILGFTIATL